MFEEIPQDFDRLDRKERANLPSYGLDLRPVRERIRDFFEIILPLDEERARYEASRCIHCPDPAGCVTACPLHNHIPQAMGLIERGQFVDAASVFRLTSTFPEVCGRVCPQEKLCEGSCVIGRFSQPVHIGALEAFAADYQQRTGSVGISLPSMPQDRHNQRVAVIGGGPSGLSCAESLLSRGYRVTLFDDKPVPGGLLLYGIPGFKLSSVVLFNKLRNLCAAGIEFVTGVCIGKDKTIDDLKREGYAAIYVSVGALMEVPMQVDGETLQGVCKGLDFLIRANVDSSVLPPGMTSTMDLRGKRLVVIGGGDTASDCTRTALRLGAKKVTCIYRRTEQEMPGVQKDRNLAREEGVEYLFLTQPVRFLGDENGHLKTLECVRMELGEPDGKGRRRPEQINGSNFRLDADMAILALGFQADTLVPRTAPGLKISKRGLIVVEPESGATSLPGVFAGGDAVNGPDIVVTALADGRRAAKSIDDYLTSLRK